MKSPIIPSVNYHLWKPCNMRCKFCFAAFNDLSRDELPKGHLPRQRSLEVVRKLAAFGFQKITFAGGEPTLCPWLPELIAEAKRAGLTTMIVTNGSRLTDTFLAKLSPHLDWITLSTDSLDEETNLRSGRAVAGKGQRQVLSEDDYRELARQIKGCGIRLKLNTVVHSLNYREDFHQFLEAINPERWKVLQVLPISGENDACFADFSISTAAYNSFLDRHRDVPYMIPEDNNAMSGSYAMVNPAGEFYTNRRGKYERSLPILEVGAPAAYQSMGYSRRKFAARGGQYQWERRPSPLTLSKLNVPTPRRFSPSG